MKKVLISVVFILVAIVCHNLGYKKGRETGREIGFRDGWEACEKDASCDWNEWH